MASSLTILLTVATSVLLAGAAGEKSASKPDHASVPGQARISLTQATWAKGVPISIEITVTGRGAGWCCVIPTLQVRRKGLLDGIERERERYWAPFDFSTGKPQGANETCRIDLDSSGKARVRLEAQALLWERGISSSWPSRDLYERVPPGRYMLRFEAHVGAGGHDRIRSNEVEVVVDAPHN